MTWLNYNNTTRFSKFFKLLPLSFDISISAEQIVTIRLSNFSINTHSKRKFYYNNRFHNLFLLIFNFYEIANAQTSLVDAITYPPHKVCLVFIVGTPEPLKVTGVIH